MALAASERESKPRHRIGILSLLGAVRTASSVRGRLSFTVQPDIDYKDSVSRVLSWRRALVKAWRAGQVTDADLRDLMVLHDCAQPNGALCLSNRSGAHRWWTEEQLAPRLRITAKTFRA